MASKKVASKSSVANDAYIGLITCSRSKESPRSRIKDTMAEMERKINLLVKVMEEQDHEIAALREKMQTREIAESSQTLMVKATDKGKNVVQENQPEQQLASVASLLVQ
ncbi:ty3-gypsy retrotransposon protein [Cucumis melo var. makuwa]|uniref:Ty3-gypsy retrotransposon protein n=1 Tax=Cucumis melo var. makuwa TaxID=1194695 RepID=A0A5D3D5H5_CUCMM|nr:ty3-gypsy retrotransposon protein [Cucumis melo var. makuwa]TYK18803.1 ty3-gypsy retrotransposon protein [Cucumis melo var. makuwa]